MQVFEPLRALEFDGGYDAVHLPLSLRLGSLSVRLAPRDRSDRWCDGQGDTQAHLRLCYSRKLFVRAYPQGHSHLRDRARARGIGTPCPSFLSRHSIDLQLTC